MFILICNYCDYRWKIYLKSNTVVKCPNCKDTNIKSIPANSGIDYYAGSPVFEPKKEEVALEDRPGTYPTDNDSYGDPFSWD